MECDTLYDDYIYNHNHILNFAPEYIFLTINYIFWIYKTMMHIYESCKSDSAARTAKILLGIFQMISIQEGETKHAINQQYSISYHNMWLI